MLGLLVALWVEPAPVDLRWSGACDEAKAVEIRLDEELRSAEDTDRWVRVEADVDVSESEGGFEADVTLTTESGATRRILSAGDCGELQQAVALLLAIHVDPLGAQQLEAQAEPEPEPEGEHAAEPELEPRPAPEPQVEVAPVRVVQPTLEPVSPAAVPERGHGFLRAGVGISAGVLPAAAPTFELSGGWVRRHVRLDARASYLPPQDDRVDEGSVTYQAWDVGARGCGLILPGSLVVPLCGGVGGGAVHGGSSGLDENARDARGLVYVSGSAGVDWTLAARFAFWARIEGGSTLLRPKFDIEGLGTVHTARSWRAGVTIGVGFDFL